MFLLMGFYCRRLLMKRRVGICVLLMITPRMFACGNRGNLSGGGRVIRVSGNRLTLGVVLLLLRTTVP